MSPHRHTPLGCAGFLDVSLALRMGRKSLLLKQKHHTEQPYDVVAAKAGLRRPRQSRVRSSLQQFEVDEVRRSPAIAALSHHIHTHTHTPLAPAVVFTFGTRFLSPCHLAVSGFACVGFCFLFLLHACRPERRLTPATNCPRTPRPPPQLTTCCPLVNEPSPQRAHALHNSTSVWSSARSCLEATRSTMPRLRRLGAWSAATMKKSGLSSRFFRGTTCTTAAPRAPFPHRRVEQLRLRLQPALPRPQSRQPPPRPRQRPRPRKTVCPPPRLFLRSPPTPAWNPLLLLAAT